MSGGTFTITNMAHSVVDFFTPILKPGETGILGVGRVVEKPVVREGAIVARSMMGLTSPLTTGWRTARPRRNS